jgi:hypothetical protein
MSFLRWNSGTLDFDSIAVVVRRARVATASSEPKLSVMVFPKNFSIVFRSCGTGELRGYLWDESVSWHF